MTGNVISLVIGMSGGNWDRERWQQRLSALLPDHQVLIADGDVIDPRTHYACVWKPPRGSLARLKELKFMFNLGAGVDALLTDPTLPDVPLIRTVNDNLTARMSEYIVLHVLMHHRQQRIHDAAQARREWIGPYQWAASALRVGVLGTGVLGADAMQKLAMIGFDVAGWSRRRKTIDGLTLYAGADELDAFLARTDVLVALIPSTPDTAGFLNRALFEKLSRSGPLGGPVLINAGRGALQNEDDLVACLRDGTLKAATLDVFQVEPLPPDHPLWTLPNVTITPHNAADSEPDAIAEAVARQITAFERGEPLTHVVDRATGY